MKKMLKQFIADESAQPPSIMACSPPVYWGTDEVDQYRVRRNATRKGRQGGETRGGVGER